MRTTVEMAQSPLKAERDAGIERIIESAVRLAKDPKWDKRRVYSITSELIADFALPGDECEQAIKQLKEALNV